MKFVTLKDKILKPLYTCAKVLRVLQKMLSPLKIKRAWPKKMTGKLIFSLSDNMNLAYNPFADGSIIKFGKGFEDLQLSVSGPEFTIVSPAEIANRKPVLEFTLGCGSQTAPVAPRPSVFARIEQPSQDQKLKSVIVADSVTPFSAPSKFEIGSSSNMSTIMTKTQRRNKNHHTKRRMEKLGLSSQNEQTPPTSPHLSGSRFHLLSAADGEEDVRKIARSVPIAVGKSVTEPVKDKETLIQNMKTSRQLSPSSMTPQEVRKVQRFSCVHSSPWIDRHPSTDPSSSSHPDVGRLESSSQLSRTSAEKKIWRPKEEVASLVVASPEKMIEKKPEVEEKREINPPDHMDYERYVPVDPHYVSGRSIEEMLGELKNSIKDLEDEDALNFDLDQDDMLDDAVADVLMVETRRSAHDDQAEDAGIQDVVVEEGIAPDLTQRLIQQLK
ncbi:hypothetical protein IEQ34_006018 [Dendrobium chrysotoxum]|uniref:Uncharacterized protein n=1 Tax=Dendrobium chrysotoxum TaxID=161865 RepID=A0AAV7GVM2_DENCH|nr:hypothetical protein IEQ34_006018 [Dendrobium chrysotoxum]